MAHFAQLDDDGVVTQVIVVSNEDILDENGAESEGVGLAFIASLGLPGRWVQTSYNRNFRGNYAGIGYTYDEERDVFLPSCPGEGWTLNEERWEWDPPAGWEDWAADPA